MALRVSDTVETPPRWSARPRTTGPRISIVLPAYNEAQRLGSSLDRLLEDLTLRDLQAEVIVVDDGSEDGTAQVARRHLAHAQDARLLRLPWHLGKGAAVRLGIASARGDFVVFMDADLATDLAVLPQAIDLLARYDIVVGSRAAVGATVTGRSPARSVMSRAFSAQARQITGIGATDPQCGFKAFRAPAAKLVFNLSRLNGFGFDVEILLLAHRVGLRVAEVPVQWSAVAGSKVRTLRDPIAMAFDITRVYMHHRRHRPVPAELTRGA